MRNKMGKNYIVEYSKDGIPISDYEIEDYILYNYPGSIKVSTINVFFSVRVLAKRKVISYDDLTIIFEGTELDVDKSGEIINWKDLGLSYSCIDRWLDELLEGENDG